MIHPILDLDHCKTAAPIDSYTPARDRLTTTVMRFTWSEPVLEPYVRLFLQEFTKNSRCRIKAVNHQEGPHAPRTGLDGLEVYCPQDWQQVAMCALMLTAEAMESTWGRIISRAIDQHQANEQAERDGLERLRKL